MFLLRFLLSVFISLFSGRIFSVFSTGKTSALGSLTVYLIFRRGITRVILRMRLKAFGAVTASAVLACFRLLVVLFIILYSNFRFRSVRMFIFANGAGFIISFMAAMSISAFAEAAGS